MINLIVDMFRTKLVIILQPLYDELKQIKTLLKPEEKIKCIGRTCENCNKSFECKLPNELILLEVLENQYYQRRIFIVNNGVSFLVHDCVLCRESKQINDYKANYITRMAYGMKEALPVAKRKKKK